MICPRILELGHCATHVSTRSQGTQTHTYSLTQVKDTPKYTDAGGAGGTGDGGCGPRLHWTGRCGRVGEIEKDPHAWLALAGPCG